MVIPELKLHSQLPDLIHQILRTILEKRLGTRQVKSRNHSNGSRRAEGGSAQNEATLYNYHIVLNPMETAWNGMPNLT